MIGVDRAIRIAAAVSVLGVAGIAAVISYQHAYALVVAHGESGATARALPLTVDGLIVTCSLVLLDAARRRQQAPLLAWLLLGCGIVATLGANAAHGLAHGPVGAVIAGWPALVAVGSFEMLARLIRGGRAEPGEVLSAVATGDEMRDEKGAHEASTLGATSTIGVANGHALPWWPLPDVDSGPIGMEWWEHVPADAEPVATAALDEEDRGTRMVGTVAADLPGPVVATATIRADGGESDGPEPSSNLDEGEATDPDLAPVIATARDRFAGVLATGALPSVRAIRRELRVGHPRAVRVRQALQDMA